MTSKEFLWNFGKGFLLYSTVEFPLSIYFEIYPLFFAALGKSFVGIAALALYGYEAKRMSRTQIV